LAKQQAIALPVIRRVSRRKPIPMSHAQQRLWFLDKFAEGKDCSYLMGCVFELQGVLDVDAFTKSVAFLMKRHEGLRTIFVEKEGVGYQAFLPLSRFQLVTQHVTLTALDEQLTTLWNTPFNLSTDPLVSWNLYHVTTEHSILALKIHHIISDGWSLMRLLAELSASYAALLQGKQPSLVS
jgi:NRPS condensation-like uncharacterized protein